MAISILQDGQNQNLSSGIIAIHAALVPTKTAPAIVYFGTNDQARIYRLDQPTTAPVQLGTKPGWWAFCAGHAFLQDGRWIIAGGVVNQNVDHHGHDDHDSGEHRCEIYLPLEERFEPIQDLNFQPGASHGGGRWYPTVLTLANGQVFCVAGHPFSGHKVPNPDWHDGLPEDTDIPKQIDDNTGTDNYVFGNDTLHRHNNNTPERYLTNQDVWVQLVNESTSFNNQKIDEYPRLYLAPSGHVFFSTRAKGDKRFYDPFNGSYLSEEVQPADGDYHAGSETTSVMLPILPDELDEVWVLACGSASTQRINIGKSGSEWEDIGSPPLGKARQHACAVTLPTGSVFLNAGEVEDGPERPASELYHPPINWNTLRYQSNEDGSWEQIEAPQIKRGYHGVALLMPDGRVWIAGSTWSDWDQSGVEMEVYSPPYYQPNRFSITNPPPSVGYGGVVDLTVSSNTAITRAVMIRCGSVTHAFDSDQRYVVCKFQQNGTHVQVRAPAAPGLAPPGNYMMFLLDDQMVGGHGRPCMEAPIIRVCDQTCTPVLNMSTYSKLTTDALKNNDGWATVSDAAWLFLENFRPHEVDFPNQPTVEVRWDSSGGSLIGSNLIQLAWQNPWAENATLPDDQAQRFTLRYNVRVHENVFSNVNVTRNIHITWRFAHATCQTSAQLSTKPNPFMVDVKDGNPHWLSTDLRTFSVRAGAPPPPGAPSLGVGETPYDYLQKALTDYNANANVADNPFDDIDDGQDTSAVELRKTIDNAAVYNFAVARVRYVAQGQNADHVRVLFRMFNTVGTALEYDTSSTYRRNKSGPEANALLGHEGVLLISVPFFAEPRDTPSIAMDKQTPDAPQTLIAQGAAEHTRYFGAWLDVNQHDQRHIPPLYWGDGPFPQILPPFSPVSIKEVVRNYHQCLVAEVHFGDDPIADVNSSQAGTPANNDNLSQRNLAWVPAGNPGSASTRVVQTTFLARPSGTIPSDKLMPAQTVPLGQVLGLQSTSLASVDRRLMPDELIFDGSNVPAGTRVSIYWPDVDLEEILMLYERRPSGIKVKREDEHTLSFELNGTAYLPLPGGRTMPIPGLMSAELPEGIKAGEKYHIVVHQFSGRKRRVIGSFQLQIPVAKEADLLESETTKYSILKWIGERVPAADPWKPVFERYLGQIADRVTGFGGNPDDIPGSPDGDGRDPETESNHPDNDKKPEFATGKISSICYDCHGDFEGFELIDCDQTWFFNCRERNMLKLLRRACEERLRVTVKYFEDDKCCPVNLWIHCV